MLTHAQRNLLIYLCDAIDSTGVAPSYAEIAAGLGLKSRSGIKRLLNALQDKGYVRAWDRRARCIEIIRRSGEAPRGSTVRVHPAVSATDNRRVVRLTVGDYRQIGSVTTLDAIAVAELTPNAARWLARTLNESAATVEGEVTA